MSARVSGLALTPVKATRLRDVEEILLEREGVRENRRFYLIDERDRMVNGKRLGALTRVVSDYDDSARHLVLRFPDGRIVEDDVRPGKEITTKFFSRPAVGRIVDGPFSAALSAHAGEPLRLVEALRPGGAVDRGAGGAASLISRASLDRLAEVAGVGGVDARRFRMLIEIDGVPAHAEDAWVGRRVTVGQAVLAMRGHVGRCLITSRDPESGEIDLPTLDVLRGYRTAVNATEPLPFGVYGPVVRGGHVRIGDPVTLESR